MIFASCLKHVKTCLGVNFKPVVHARVQLRIAGLPTFRNCLEGETSSTKHKNPQVWSRPYRAPWWGPGAKPLTRVQGSARLCKKFVFDEVKCIISGPYVAQICKSVPYMIWGTAVQYKRKS